MMVFSRRKCITCVPCTVMFLMLVTVYLQIHTNPLITTKLSLVLDRLKFEEDRSQVSPPPCINAFLESVEPTVNFKPFCDRTWNQSDIICKQFLSQNGLELKDNCLFPKGVNVVPRLVYYVIFSKEPGKPPEFLFMHYLSIMSAKRFISPWAIYVISDAPPSGYWWMRVRSDIKGVRYVFRQPPYLTSQKLVYIQHASDVVRLQTLIVNGGIYLDTDMLLLQPIDVLLNNTLTMGLVDNATGMGNAFIAAERGNPLLVEWYKAYRQFNRTSFYENSLWTAKKLWLLNPSAVNEISSRIYRPNWFESKKLFKEAGYDWRSRLAVHIWHRHGHVPVNPSEIESLNTTLGEIFRFLYNGNSVIV